jgi:hypothetical protein
VYQVRQPKNRHLVDVRQVAELPPAEVRSNVAVVSPVELAAMKVEALVHRAKKEKGLSDRLDLVRLLRAFPHLREANGDVTTRLRAGQHGDASVKLWDVLRQEHFEADTEDDAW